MAEAPAADDFFAHGGGGAALPSSDDFFGPPPAPKSGGALDSIWNSTKTVLGSVANVFGEFGEAGARAFDPDSLGIPSDTVEQMRQHGFLNDFKGSHQSFLESAQTAIMRPAIALANGVYTAGQLAIRTPGAVVEGVAGALGQTGKEISGEQPGPIRATVGEAFRQAAGFVESAPQAFMPGMFGEPVAGPVRTAEEASTEQAATAAAQTEHVAAAHSARAAGVVGEGEGGYYGATPITPENVAARQAAAREAAVEMPEPLPPPVDVHELARRIDPETVSAWDTLEAQRATERETLAKLEQERQASPEVAEARKTVDEILGHQEDEPLSVRMARADAFRASAPEPMVAKLDQALAKLDELVDRDTPEMIAARERLVQADYAMRDLAVPLSEAYRQAREMAPQLPEAAPIEQVAATAAGASKEGEAAVAPPSVTGDQKLGAVSHETARPIGAPGTPLGQEPMPVEQAQDVAAQAASPAGTGGELEDIAGTGELKVRGAARSLEEKAAADRLATNFGNLPEYRTLDFNEQAARVTNLIADDYEQAKRMAMGYEPTPEGMVPSIVWSEVANHAAEIGDFETVNRLAKSRIVTGGTAAGRYIAGFGRLENESPVSKIQEVAQARAAAVAKTVDIPAATRETVAEMKTEIAKTAKVDKWASFISSLEC